MRISDWSSDVCSSDLGGHDRGDPEIAADRDQMGLHQPARGRAADEEGAEEDPEGERPRDTAQHEQRRYQHRGERTGIFGFARSLARAIRQRSEEHTSELHSLMRISYAVFCLKKKNDTTHHT